MIKKVLFLLLCSGVHVYTCEKDKFFTPEIIRKIKNCKIRFDQKKAIIGEFKEILKNGVIPLEPIYAWLKKRLNVLLCSPKAAVRDAGELLKNVHSGNVLSVNSFQAVPTIIKAVKAHDEDFSLTWFESGKALAVGTQWFFSNIPGIQSNQGDSSEK